MDTIKQGTQKSDIDRILENLFEVLPVIHRKLLRMDLGGVVGDMTRLHFAIMGKLKVRSMTASELARQSMIPRPQITHLVDQLVQEGLVDRKPDYFDRRMINLVLTSKGVAVLRDLKNKVQCGIRTSLAGLTPEELNEMSEALEKLRRIGAKL